MNTSISSLLLLIIISSLSTTSSGLFNDDNASTISLHPNEPNHRSLAADASNTKPYYTVREIDRKLEHIFPADVHIKIFNHQHPTKWYSVTIVSQGVYTGTASFLRLVKDRPGTPLLYSWIPKVKGDYEIIVHELGSKENNPYTPPMAGEYKFTVTDKQGYDSHVNIMHEIARMPPCQTVDNRQDLYTVWDGSWIGPNMHGNLPGMRTGWYFLPSKDMNCNIEYFTDEELRKNPEEKSIYILGSSKERGIFLSLVDMILDGEEKERLHDSVIAKCWGRAFVFKNNLKVLYQDWRSNYFQNAGASSDYLCHNEKVVREGGMTYTENGHKVWDEIFRDPSSWPSVILMSTGNHEGFYGGYDLQHFINRLPSTWKGKLLLTDGAFSAMRAGDGDEGAYVKYRNFIRELVFGLKDSRVHWLDGKGLSKEHRMYAENGPDHVTGSQHFHKLCKSSYMDTNGQEQPMNICSNVTEVIGQLLIGYALGPKEEYLKRIANTASLYNGNKELMYCHACPEDLLPFHITPEPPMMCDAGTLHAQSRSEIHAGAPQLCPKPCFDIPPSNEVQTQSGIVYERNCPMEYFVQPTDADFESLDKMTKEIDQLEQELKQITAANQVVQQMNQSPPEVRQAALKSSNANAFISESEVDMPPSLYNLWIINAVILAILAMCYRSKIQSILQDNWNNTENPYSSLSRLHLSFNRLHGDKAPKKYVLGAGVGLLVGLVCIASFPSKDKNQSLLNTSMILRSNSITASRRPVMTTFFEPVKGGCCGMSEKGHLNLVAAWEKAWRSLGWDTKVYNEADARRHPKFKLASQKLHDVGLNEYEQRCVWRWLAAANDDDPMGGWQSDYDTFPLSLTAEQGLNLMNIPGFKSWTKHVPSLLHGDQHSWNRIVDMMIDHIRGDLDTKYQLSDMVIIMYLRDHYDLLMDLGITVWEDKVYSGFPYHSDDVKPTINCDTAKEYLAAHISHAASQADYNEKHTYPKLEGKGGVVLSDGVHYFAEYRAEAATVMMEDFSRECTGNQ